MCTIAFTCTSLSIRCVDTLFTLHLRDMLSCVRTYTERGAFNPVCPCNVIGSQWTCDGFHCRGWISQFSHRYRCLDPYCDFDLCETCWKGYLLLFPLFATSFLRYQSPCCCTLTCTIS